MLLLFFKHNDKRQRKHTTDTVQILQLQLQLVFINKEKETTVLNRQSTYYLQGMTKQMTVVVLISFLNQEAPYFV